ncbi:TetR/AcrR family transcriptional regulator [Sphingobacterium sp. PU5-4]|uniref:TetR/AcrR family transcriptional regulator n=1 Tax=Sphingobacterium tenebrionis TaxID=3111775 RepID=A0ABU8I6K9_9SPHI
MENRKDQIIEVALKRFSHFGFHKTTMNEIADDLLITKANLYYYYPDKPSLIIDVLCKIASDLHEAELAIVEKYNGDILKVVNEVIETRSRFMRKYYLFHINENLDWIKGIDLTDTMEKFYKRDVEVLKSLLNKAVEAGELKMNNIDEAAVCLTEIQKGIALLHTVADVITGIPNDSNVDKILESQKRSAKLIFDGKINRN